MTQRFPVSQFEVRGQSAQGVLDALSIIHERALKILADQGITRIDNDGWYPLDRFLAVFQTIQREIGLNTTKAVGRRIPANAVFPPNIVTVDDAYRCIDMAYRMNHRGSGNIGGYQYTRTGDRSARMICDNPYPCPMDEGLLEAMGERFRPQDSLWVRVEHQPGACRRDGADSCTFHLSW